MTAQALLQQVGTRILPTPKPDIGPVSHSFPLPSCERLPLPPPDPNLWGLSAPDMQDPPPEADLNLGINLSDLVPKVPNPGSLLAVLDYYSHYNGASVASA